jgi:hypothetical protein
MSTFSLRRSRRHRQRYREIAGVFLRHGFGFLFQHLRLLSRAWCSSSQAMASATVCGKTNSSHVNRPGPNLGQSVTAIGFAAGCLTFNPAWLYW